MIRLGVNIDHAATLRQVRGGTTAYPDIVTMARLALKAGAEQITIHLREDRRHIQEADLANLVKLRDRAQPHFEINLEMAVTPQMQKMALRYRPNWICLVPEKRAELTTEGGLDVKKQLQKISKLIDKTRQIGIQSSLFIDPDEHQVKASFAAGAEAVEFHTGAWVLAQGQKKQALWRRLTHAAKLADELGLYVHAGHGLETVHSKKIRSLPALREVNVGHYLICRALEVGLEAAVRELRQCLIT